MTRVALIGLGEVGRTFAEGLREVGIEDIRAWDTAFTDAESRASRNARDLKLSVSPSASDAVTDADLVVSAVTAAQCIEAALDACPGLADGAWFFDLNSSSPEHKREAARTVEAFGARYVEAALMSPIGPRRLASPFLLGGPHARHFVDAATRYGLSSVEAVSEIVGRAAATKLCRSVIVKGLESLMTEALLTARVYGVERDVVDSLSNILPPADWDAIAGYFISRSLQHGQRRSEEMAEAAATVADAGIEPLMSRAAVHRQAWAAQFHDVLPSESTQELLDGILQAIPVTRSAGWEAGS